MVYEHARTGKRTRLIVTDRILTLVAFVIALSYNSFITSNIVSNTLGFFLELTKDFIYLFNGVNCY